MNQEKFVNTRKSGDEQKTLRSETNIEFDSDVIDRHDDGDKDLAPSLTPDL